MRSVAVLSAVTWVCLSWPTRDLLAQYYPQPNVYSPPAMPGTAYGLPRGTRPKLPAATYQPLPAAPGGYPPRSTYRSAPAPTAPPSHTTTAPVRPGGTGSWRSSAPGAAATTAPPPTQGVHSHSSTARPVSTPSVTHAEGHSHGGPPSRQSRHPPQYTSAGYAGDDLHLRPVPIPGLRMESRGTPIETYYVPPDPRTGTQPGLAWWGAATVLADGAPHAIDLGNQDRGLDSWSSANIKTAPDGTPDYSLGSYKLNRRTGLPDLSIRVQRDPTDPTKWAPVLGPDGHPVSTTALQHKGQYVDSSSVPGVAINQKLRDQHNLRLGDPVYVYNSETGLGAWGTVMDMKGAERKENTEVTVDMARRIGINPDARRGGTTRPSLVYSAYPGAGKGPETRPEDWQPGAIEGAGQRAAWDHGFDPAQTQWHLPAPQQPTTAATPTKPPRKQAAAPAQRTSPRTPAAEESQTLPDEAYMPR